MTGHASTEPQTRPAIRKRVMASPRSKIRPVYLRHRFDILMERIDVVFGTRLFEHRALAGFPISLHRRPGRVEGPGVVYCEVDFHRVAASEQFESLDDV